MTKPEKQTSGRPLRSGRKARRLTALPVAIAGALLLGLGGIATMGYAVFTQAEPTVVQAVARTTGETVSPSQTAVTTRNDPEPVEPEQPVAMAPAGILRLADPAWVARVSTESGIPTRALTAYAGADLYARTELGCPVGWNTLAAIGFVESEHGTLQGGSIGADYVASPSIIGIPLDGTSSAVIPDTDHGATDGDTTWDRAVGPMQFIPDTWNQWGTDGNGDGVADVNNMADAALTAARYLCHAHGTLEGETAWVNAIRSYNDNPEYQQRVADAASHYAGLSGQ